MTQWLHHRRWVSRTECWHLQERPLAHLLSLFIHVNSGHVIDLIYLLIPVTEKKGGLVLHLQHYSVRTAPCMMNGRTCDFRVMPRFLRDEWPHLRL